MSRTYSNKALPSGTVLREWRLEEVLGVGGFGIVYKGRGIYFDELVAIKEYFPSAISERDADDTVVPIDSDAEEVHALGLKKFVEEAKLLWNLSTPTRHPNIVSVRSLFEIHGTAYIVMDFEDGLSLSRMLKKGRKFNERSLWNIVRPIAEGLERAHRVGVLHRDIKPPNILINEDGRPVLIDFGSARFEAAEATSTKVTFHTPPYAAIEQYVKTYAQGPWTDIYALGVVLYECITGEKPAEVLERLHGGLGNPLADGKWPGYSKAFLAAVDAAMTIRPSDRPQAISEWLAMFPESAAAADDGEDGPDEDATRILAHQVTADEIIPVAPPAPDVSEAAQVIESRVPSDPKDVKFKRAGRETGPERKASTAAEAALAKGIEANAADPEPTPAATEGEISPAPPAALVKAVAKTGEPSRSKRYYLIGSGVAAVAIAAAAGLALFTLGRGDAVTKSDGPPRNVAAAEAVSVDVDDVAQLAPAVKALADAGSAAGAPATAVSDLVKGSDGLARQQQLLQAIANDPAGTTARASRAAAMRATANTLVRGFAAALLRDGESRARRVARDIPRANAAGSDSRAASADRQAAAGRVRTALAGLRLAADAAARSADTRQAFTAAREALVSSTNLAAASAAAYRLAAVARRSEAAPGLASAAPVVSTPLPATVKPATAAASSSTAMSPAKSRQFQSIIEDGRRMVRQVIAIGDRKLPSGTGDADKKLYAMRRANGALARNYDAYLVKLKDSFRGAQSDVEADRLIKQAGQTRAYLQFLVRQSGS